MLMFLLSLNKYLLFFAGILKYGVTQYTSPVLTVSFIFTTNS